MGNVLKRHGTAPAPKRSQTTTWKEFIQSHLAVLAGIDFFTVEVLSWRGLVTYYVLFFIHLESRRVTGTTTTTKTKTEEDDEDDEDDKEEEPLWSAPDDHEGDGRSRPRRSEI